MAEQARPQDPVPPGYHSGPTAESPAYQAYQQYPANPPYAAYPPPSHYPGYPPQGIAPPNHLAWAIVSIFLCMPCGIAAVIKSTQVDRFWAMGQQGLAQQASATTKVLCIISTVFASAMVVLWFSLVLMVFSRFDEVFPVPPR